MQNNNASIQIVRICILSIMIMQISKVYITYHAQWQCKNPDCVHISGGPIAVTNIKCVFFFVPREIFLIWSTTHTSLSKLHIILFLVIFVMARSKNAAEKQKILKLWKRHKNFNVVRIQFTRLHRPDKRTIQRVLATCNAGKCHLRKTGVPRVERALTAANLTEINKSVKRISKMGVRQRSAKLGMSRSSCARGLKQLGYGAYHGRIRLDLKAGTCAERL
jgi:hypothetical protein